MSTTSTEPSESTTPAQEAAEGEQPSNEPKTFDAEYVSKLRAESAKYRNEAKANAEAARRLAEYEEAQKSEAQKAADKLAAEKSRADAAERLALSLRIATEHKLGPEDAELLEGLPDEASMRKLAKRLEAQVAAQQKKGNRVPNEGTTPPKAPADENREFVRGLFGSSGA